jgi:hypothetical protein
MAVYECRKEVQDRDKILTHQAGNVEGESHKERTTGSLVAHLVRILESCCSGAVIAAVLFFITMNNNIVIIITINILGQLQGVETQNCQDLW